MEIMTTNEAMEKALHAGKPVCLVGLNGRGQVMLQLPPGYDNITFTAEQAREVAASLLNHADRAEITSTKHVTRMKRATETVLVRSLLAWLHAQGIVAWRVNSGATISEYKGRKRIIRFGSKGMSDICGVARVPVDGGTAFLGVALWIEAKMPGNRPTPAQEAFLETVRRNGGIAVVARSVDELERALRDEGVILRC